MKARRLVRLGLCLAAGLAVLAVGGCASTVRVTRMKPAEVNISEYKKVAVGQIKGRHGDGIADLLTQALFESNRFDVLDRAHLDQILREQDLADSEYADPDEAVQVGKLIGSAALIFGNVSRRDYRESTSHQRATCTSNNQKYACTQYFTKGSFTAQVGMKVVDTSTGRIIAVRNLQAGASRQASSYHDYPAPAWDVPLVLDELDRRIVADFMKMIVPYTVTEEVRMFSDGKIPELERGIRFLQGGQWTDAIASFRDGCARADGDPGIASEVKARARYDLGVALGYSGRYDEGVREIEAASRIKPEDTFFAEIRRIKGFQRDAERLREQGVESVPAS